MELDNKRMDGADEWFSEGKMSLHSLLNGDDANSESSPTVPMHTNGDLMATVSASVPDGGEQGEGLGNRTDIERYMMMRDSTLGDMDASSAYASLVQRAICSICRGETGRCHASDPASMQAFFVSSLGFDGVLSYADWLCMKCYSKWYNRCKRKASTTVLSSDAAAPPIPTPPRRKRSTSSTKQGQATSPVMAIAESKEKEREFERDMDNDDALLLTRITTHTNPSTPINIQRDLEGEVDDLRDELHRVKGEVGRLSQELSKRDGQMEEMLKFVKTEIAAMHVLLKEIAEAKWKTNNNNNSHHPMVNNNVIAIPSPPNVHIQAGSPSVVYIPPTSSNHTEWRTK